MIKNLILSITFLCSFAIYGQSSTEFFTKSDAFFKQYVKEGKIAYKAIHNAPEDLNNLLQLAKETNIPVAEANTFRSFWINTYNLLVIKGIIDNYPINSPLDKSGFFDKIKYNVGGKSITLNVIENDLLRGNFDDARIHFVLVCGALGCPPIINKAYTPENLDALLTKQTTIALNNPEFIKVKSKKVQLSEIFKWYREDFGKTDAQVVQFVNKYRKEAITERARISYYPYNWKLNKQ